MTKAQIEHMVSERVEDMKAYFIDCLDQYLIEQEERLKVCWDVVANEQWHKNFQRYELEEAIERVLNKRGKQ